MLCFINKNQLKKVNIKNSHAFIETSNAFYEVQKAML